MTTSLTVATMVTTSTMLTVDVILIRFLSGSSRGVLVLCWYRIRSVVGSRVGIPVSSMNTSP
ncbi:hypothetical protein [Vibrio splendidus]|uniref:hypothetical protein n=1 Tax=Vibrio splendidus TaxID=29497 RepID=UPI0011B209E7|nr:hypothetical protein [Vibrio splendidus]MCW4441077.1 hypothetical protein [Vibrio splendidus]